jgi:uncharacterized membrane protein
MPRIAHFILIDAPIERGFAFLADYRNLPRIQAEFSSVRLLTPQQPEGQGAQIEAKGSFRGMPITAHMTIVQFERPHLLVSDTAGAVRSRSTWRFREQPGPTPGDPVRLRVSVTVDYEIAIPGLSFIGHLVQRDLDGMTQDALRRLKVLLEADS